MSGQPSGPPRGASNSNGVRRGSGEQQQQQQGQGSPAMTGQMPQMYYAQPGMYGAMPVRPGSAGGQPGMVNSPQAGPVPGMPRGAPFYGYVPQYPPQFYPYMGHQMQAQTGGEGSDGNSPNVSPSIVPQHVPYGAYGRPQYPGYPPQQVFYAPNTSAPGDGGASGAPRPPTQNAPPPKKTLSIIDPKTGQPITIERKDPPKPKAPGPPAPAAPVPGPATPAVPPVAPVPTQAAPTPAASATAAPVAPAAASAAGNKPGGPSSGQSALYEAVKQRFAQDAKEESVSPDVEKKRKEELDRQQKEKEAQAKAEEQARQAEEKRKKLQEQAERQRKEMEAKRKVDEARQATEEKKLRAQEDAKKASIGFAGSVNNNNSSGSGDAAAAAAPNRKDKSSGEKIQYSLQELLEFKIRYTDMPEDLANVSFDAVPVRPGMQQRGPGGFGGQRGGFGNQPNYNQQVRGGPQWNRGGAIGGGRGMMRGPRGPVMGGGIVVEPIKRSENAWKASKAQNEHEATIKKVKGILNKLTLEKFDSLSKQMVEVPMTSLKTLRETMAAVFDKALTEPKFGELYANLCKVIVDHHKKGHVWDFVEIVPKDGEFYWTASNDEEEDDSTRLIGPFKTEEEARSQSLKMTDFKRILLNKCQEEFEKEAQIKTAEEEVEAMKAKVAAETDEEELTKLKEELQDLVYAALKIKRKVLGNIQFIGELYKKQILTEKVMHSCIAKILNPPEEKKAAYADGSKVYIPPEEDLECLCKLLATIGLVLDSSSNDETKARVEHYFDALKRITKTKELDARHRFMVLDVIELRNNKWKARREELKVKKIEDVHKDMKREEAEKAREMAQNRNNVPHQRSGGNMGGRQGGMQGGNRWGGGNAPGGGRPVMGSIAASSTMNQGYKLGGNQRPAGGLGGSGARTGAASGSTSSNRSAGMSMRPGGGGPGNAFRPGGTGITGRTGIGKANLFQRGGPQGGGGRGQGSGGKNQSDKDDVEKIDKDKMERKVNNMFDEYVNLNMEEELIETYKEIETQVETVEALRDYTIACAVSLCIEKKDDYRRFVPKAVMILVEKKFLETADIVRALNDRLEFLGDEMLDSPKAADHVGGLLGHFIIEKALSLGNLQDCVEKFMQETPHHGKKLLSSILKHLVSSPEGIEIGKEQIGDVDIKSFIGGARAKDEDVENFFKDNNLQELR